MENRILWLINSACVESIELGIPKVFEHNNIVSLMIWYANLKP